MEKDYSLLRPFDLEAAKRGEKICNGNETILRFTAGPHIKNNSVVTENEFGFFTIHKDSLFMLPLAWVEMQEVAQHIDDPSLCIWRRFDKHLKTTSQNFLRD